MSDSLWNTAHVSKTEKRSNGALSPAAVHPTVSRDALFERFRSRIVHNPALDRTLVSFQANRQMPFYSWFKYKEGFSKDLVHYLLQELMPQPGVLLDPFAGIGSALFAAGELGWKAQGIEVLPVGVYAIQARLIAEHVEGQAFKQVVEQILAADFTQYADEVQAFEHIAITSGAYPPDEEIQLVGYIGYCNRCIQNQDFRELLRYAAFCVLEAISYTRKDGQYLRWDERSGRSQGKKPFNKGRIWTFREAIESKLRQMTADLNGSKKQLSFFDAPGRDKQNFDDLIRITTGSCLTVLPTLPASSIDFVLTSPPYANRYDYTRTYALELVYLGCTDKEVKQLRQAMLSCTVENKDKREQLEQYYTQRGRVADFEQIDETFNHQAALQEVLFILHASRDRGELNNPHIARLVHNYFYEMCFVIYELSRLLRPNGVIAMVNDNVRYAGEEIPVDLILSDMAETFGLTTRVIWTLGRGKGNSSQQMGNHGRAELRKCIYVWKKSDTHQ